MKHFSFWFFLYIPFLLFSDLKNPHVFAVTEGEPSWNLCKSVNAITGDLYISQIDLKVEGVQPIHLSRYYISGDGKGRFGGWEFMPHLQLQFMKNYKDKRDRILVAEPNSSPILYRQHRSDPSFFALHIDESGDGITNCSKGIISGRTNLKNQIIERISKHKFRMCSPDGTLRLYACNTNIDPNDSKHRLIYFYLQSERHPNGNRTIYEYDKDNRVSFIKTHNPTQTKTYAWIRFHYHGKPAKNPDFHVSTSDHKEIRYHFDELGKTEKHFYLSHITSKHLPDEQADYCSAHSRRGPVISRRLFPDGRALQAQYYDLGKNPVGSECIRVHNENDPICDRVKTLLFPIGKDKTPIEAYRFYYNVERHRKKENNSHYRYSGCTRVYDIENNLSIFLFTPESRPQRIEHFQNSHTLVSIEEYQWQNGTDLHTKTLLDGQRNPLQKRTFSYDEKGNVLEEKLTGNLTGNTLSSEAYTIMYAYNADNLTTYREELDGRITRFTYLPDTDLITSRLFGDKNQIRFR
ncbi:MAG: hypothetical protein HYZ47_05475, partial [Simkania negevensis]|nr:hypothetical protein [Simkania negevensis]